MLQQPEKMDEICKGICSKPVSQSPPMSTRSSAVDNSPERNEFGKDDNASILGGNVAFMGSRDASDGGEGVRRKEDSENWRMLKERDEDEGFDLFTEADKSVKGVESDGGEEYWAAGPLWDVDNEEVDDVDDMCLIGNAMKMFDGNSERVLEIGTHEFDVSVEVEYDEDDKEIDEVWEKNENKMDLWMKYRREAELRRQLHGLSTEAWDCIPLIGDDSLRHKKKRFESFVSSTDKVAWTMDEDGVTKQKGEVNGIEKNVSEVVTLPTAKNNVLVNDPRSEVGKSNAFNFDPGGDISDVSLIEVKLKDVGTHLGLLYCDDQPGVMVRDLNTRHQYATQGTTCSSLLDVANKKSCDILNDDVIHMVSGQVIPTAASFIYASQQSTRISLLKPVWVMEIQAYVQVTNKGYNQNLNHGPVQEKDRSGSSTAQGSSNMVTGDG